MKRGDFALCMDVHCALPIQYKVSRFIKSTVTCNEQRQRKPLETKSRSKKKRFVSTLIRVDSTDKDLAAKYKASIVFIYFIHIKLSRFE